jgi:methoxymalonate biosynthesis acyl carrier protein
VPDEDIQKPIFAFIADRFPDITLTSDDDIFAIGFVNSLFAMELVMFIESTFGFSIPNDALRLDNFRTVRSMAELVTKHADLVGQPLDPR